MDKDFLAELKYLGVTARVKRLGESFLYSIKELYLHANIDIEPGWHLVFLKLENEGKITMFELSESLNISKAATTKMVKKMSASGYVKIVPSTVDNRMKILSLSKKAKNRLPEFKRVWKAGRSAVEKLLEDNEHFMKALEKIEKKNYEESFSKRAIRFYENG